MIFKGLPSAIYEMVSKISNEASPLIAGFISVELVMINSSYINLFWLFFCLSMGVQFTCSAIIGNKVGQGDIIGTKNAIRSSILFAVFYAILVAIIIFTFQDYFLMKYAKSEETLELMRSMLGWFVFTLSSLIIKDILFGVIIGIGAQNQTTKVNIILNLFVWFILMYLLTFYLGYSSSGPWISLGIIGILSSLFLFRIIINTDFDMLIKDSEARRKVKKD